MTKPIKILSIDGGGIRGIIPAIILAEIEARTKKPVSAMFDLIAGTSTGGIIALALTRPGEDGTPRYSAADLVKLYEHEGGRIFDRMMWGPIGRVRNVFNEKYSATGVEGVLEEYFGDTLLSQALTNVLITSYEIEQRFPFFFKSQRAKLSPATHDYPMKKVARATSAAPTYFEPLKLDTHDLADYYALVDGGVFANNPAMCAYVEAQTLFGATQNCLVVSLGTGQLTKRLPYEKVKDWGLAEWAQPIIDVVFDGVTDTVDYQLRQLIPRRSETCSYYRFQARLGEHNERLDDVELDNLRELKLLAEDLIRTANDDINELCGQLTGVDVSTTFTLSDDERT